MERRQLLLSGLTALGATTFGLNPYVAEVAAQGKKKAVVLDTDEESGDPDAPIELLALDKQKIDQLYKGLIVMNKGVRKDAKTIALKALEISKSHLGVSRSSNPRKVTQFLNLFNLGLRYKDGQFIPYCATGVAFAACQAYCMINPQPIMFDPKTPNLKFRKVLRDIDKYYFRPSPACRYMVSDAKARGIWVPKAQANWKNLKPGWLVIFDWKQIGKANHVGFVDRSQKDILHTIEYNTSISAGGSRSNGGAVAQKERDPKYALGYIKTYPG